ncbi:hypothetical protein IGS67_12095 [Flavimobilis sp. GY10621]|uniref:DUF4878 domain-containing protein n=1 Tax=Flavimobilis rhizosphaerae TaxID=2775421 RepID=A0ABR9DSW0_9MICO|nr:hypothetical protein [Flavimobilis rhizosphaerae]MBD9700219.1 hypothetical protein [Flavimobilis rhizosphaerae]
MNQPDVDEALLRLGLRLVDDRDTTGPWMAESNDGVVHDVTALAVESVERWEVLRPRTTALLGLEHENVVPLVGALPVGDPDAEAPRTLVLVWLPALAQRRPDVARAATARELLDVLVTACRGTVALRACGIDVPGAAAVASLCAAGAWQERPQLHPWLWCGEPPAASSDLSDVTRAVAGAVARQAERDGTALPRRVRDLLTAGTGPAAPAPGDLAVRAIELLGDASVTTSPSTSGVAGAAAHGEALGGDWREIVRGGPAPLVVAPPQARRHGRLRPPEPGERRTHDPAAGSTAAPATTLPARPTAPTRVAASSTGQRGRRPSDAQASSAQVPGAPGRTAAARTPGGASLRGLRRPSGRGRRHGVVVGVVLLVAGGVGVAVHGAPFGDAPRSRPAAASATPQVTAAPPSQPEDHPVAAGAPAPGAHASGTDPVPEDTEVSGPGDPAAAARRATVGRVELLAALAPVPASRRTQAAADVDARLGELVAAGPVRDADRAFVERVLSGDEVPPQVRAEVRAAEVVSQDSASATVAMTYALVPGGGAMQQTLRLVLDGGGWKVVSVTDSSGEPRT